MTRTHSRFRSTLLFTLILSFVTSIEGRSLDTRSDYAYRPIDTRSNSIPSNAEILSALNPAPNTSWFFSGRKEPCETEADAVRPIAESMAPAHGGATLEQRLENANVNIPSYNFQTYKPQNDAWAFAAGTYAQRSSGLIFVVLGKCRPDNHWETVEYPRLTEGERVKCIFQFTPADNFKSPSVLWSASGQGSFCASQLTNKAVFSREVIAFVA